MEKAVHKFMPGDEVAIVSKPESKGGKVLAVTVDDEGKKHYTVAYGLTETIAEDDLAKLDE